MGGNHSRIESKSYYTLTSEGVVMHDSESRTVINEPTELEMGHACMNTSDFEGAVRHYGLVSPRDNKVRALLIRAYDKLGNTESVISVMSGWDYAENPPPEIRFIFAQACVTKGDMSDALSNMLTCVQERPKKFIYRLSLGRIYKNMGRYMDALEQFSIAFNTPSLTQTNNACLAEEFGDVYQHFNDWELARNCYIESFHFYQNPRSRLNVVQKLARNVLNDGENPIRQVLYNVHEYLVITRNTLQTDELNELIQNVSDRINQA